MLCLSSESPGSSYTKKDPARAAFLTKPSFTCVSFTKKCKRWQFRQDYRTTFPSFFSIRKKNVFSETFRGGRSRRHGRVFFFFRCSRDRLSRAADFSRPSLATFMQN